MRNLEWFKHGIAYDVRFTGLKVNLRNGVANRCWQRMTVFVMEDDRIEVVRETQKQAAAYGYQNVTVDHMARISCYGA